VARGSRKTFTPWGALALLGGLAAGDPASAAGPDDEGNSPWAVPLSQLSATRERPLFSASRRPPTSAIPSRPEAGPTARTPIAIPAPPFILVGTIIGDDDRIGIFQNQATKNAARIREGEGDLGWTLQSISARSAVMEGFGQAVTLTMTRSQASSETVAAAPDPTGINLAPKGVNSRTAARGGGG